MNIFDLKGNCTGCGACVVSCPKDALKLELNNDGFLEPIIDKNKCIDCGICTKVCPKNLDLLEDTLQLKNGNLYNASSKNKLTNLSCATGGVAYQFSKFAITNGFKVFGTIFDYDKLIAKTILTDNLADLKILKGSKYLQSHTVEGLKKLIFDAKENSENKYLIFGMPCQIAGIKNLVKVKKLKNQFVFIELFCYGVPSYNMWKKYLNDIQNEYKLGKIKNVNFRDKSNGWQNYIMNIKGENNTYKMDAEHDYFYLQYFNKIKLNKSCYTCEYRKGKSFADIRIGDFWGELNKDEKLGKSAIITLTKKGEQFLNQIYTSLNIENIKDVSKCLLNQSYMDYEN